MKKIFLSFAIAFACGSMAFAQFKPEKGDITTELQFSPLAIYNFTSNPSVFSMNGLRGRFFLNDKMAIRLALNVALNTINKETPIDDYTFGHFYEKKTYKSNIMDFAILPGFEFHFSGSERLSIYAGIEFGFIMRNANSDYSQESTSENPNNPTETRTRIIKGDGISLYEDDYYDGVRGYKGLKAIILTGIDFYVYKGLYLGAELGFGFTSKWDIKATKTMKTTYNLYPQNNIDRETKLDGKNNESMLTFACSPLIRLGWKF